MNDAPDVRAVSEPASGFSPLAVAWRGHDGVFEHTENVHWGIISVVAGDGREIAAVGDTARAFPLRSTAKAVQLLPFLLERLHQQEGGRRYDLADLALMMASHGGEPMHTERVRAILEDAGVPVEALLCGTHPPFHAGTREAMLRSGTPPSALHCNCSGKHANMLLVCRHRGWPLQTYLELTHPLQQRIAALLAALCGTHAPPLPWTTDGCSLPSFVVPLVSLARLYAHLAFPQEAGAVEGRDVKGELALLYRAATTHPEMIAGTGCLDTVLMNSMRGHVFAKSGAAGMYAMAVRPDARYPKGVGVAIKLADPDADSRVRAVVALEVLRRIGLVRGAGRGLSAALRAAAGGKLVNLRGLVVGAIRPCFELTV